MSKRRESALVTGAARGIGFAIAKKLASRGINVLLADIEEELCNESAEQLRAEYKVDAIAIRADMTVEEDIKNMVEFAIQRWGRLDWAANNAGVGEQLDDDEEDVTGAQFDKLYAINQRGVWLCQKYEALQMKKQELLLPLGTSSSLGGVPQRGAICNTASMCGHMSEGMPCYTATKHAILGITKTGGMFYGPHGIRCNALSPGCVLTEEYESWRQTLKGDRFHVQATGWKDRTPLHRASTPAEQANVASFLLSGESSFVNCANIIVDGGLTVCIDK